MKVQIGFSKLIVIVAILIAGQSFGQSSYVKLTDASGVGPSTSMLNELQEAADSLVSILPTEYMDDFKVYDFGFYQHLEDYDGFGYPEGFTAMLDKINTPYYLVFGRQTDQSGVNVKVWVEFKFDTQPFLCLDELELKNSIESRVIQLLNDGSNIYQCEFKILDEMLVRLQDGFCCSEALLKNGNNSYCANVDSLNVLSAMQCIQSSEHLTYLIEGFMTVYQFISKCNGTNWKTFVDGKGIIPHCLWDGKVYTKYIVGDIPFQCGVIDGLYQEIEELLKFTFSIYDIQAALRQAAIKLSLGYVECGIAESISPNQFCSVNGISVLEWKQACYTLRHDPSLWINMQYEYEMYIAWYDEVKPTESSFLWTNIDCDAVYRLQESIHMTYLALTCSETYVEAYEDIVNYTIGFWESVDGISNEERYLHGYYGVQVATLFIPFTKLKSLDDLYAYLNGLKNKISTQVDNYLGKVSQSMAPDLLNKVISKKQWYKELSISEKAKFELDFGNSAKALLWFNGNRVKAWKALDDLGVDQAIRRNVTHLENVDGYFAKYPNRTSADLATTANQFDNVEDYLNVLPDITQNSLVKGTRFNHFSDPAITNYNGNFSHAEYSFSLWKNNKWDELEDFFTANNLNGGWPPNEGFKNVVNSETGAQLVGKKFDRFQGPGDISGGFASPVYSGEDIGDLFFTYDSRALKYDIAEGTQYILFEVKSSVPSGLKFDYGEVTPWFGKQGLGDQVKSSMRLEDVKDHLEIIDTKTYINGQWQ